MRALFLFSFLLSVSFGFHPLTVNAQRVTTIYLSFDDGPCLGTNELDSLVTLDSIPVNVFIIGKHVFKNDSMHAFFRRYEQNPWIETGNHSYTHANGKYRKYYKNAALVLADFTLNRDSLHLDNNIARMPGRNYWRIGDKLQDDIVNGREAADSLAAHGYRVFGWDIEWRPDTATGLPLHTGAEMLRIVNRMVRERQTFAKNKVVILLHDPLLENAGFRAALVDFVKLARKSGNYRFDHLSNY